MEIEIRHAQKGEPLLDQVERFLVRMYEDMSEKGLLLPLAPGGEALWRRSIEAGLGRFSALVLAVRGETLCGFVYGALRLTPDYLGGEKVGLLGHMYVIPEERRHGLGKKMYACLEEWFRDQSVESLELQVLCGNAPSISMCEQFGYRSELIQMRKFL
jgi:GNAT superfamily N-acetyltransferase